MTDGRAKAAAAVVHGRQQRILEIGTGFSEELSELCDEFVRDGDEVAGLFDIIWVNDADDVEFLYKKYISMLTSSGRLILLPAEGTDRKASESILQRVGAEYRIYYPYPHMNDLLYLFSDSRMPCKSELIYGEMTGGFIMTIFSGNEHDDMHYCKMSVSRLAPYRVYTDIAVRDGEMYAVKNAFDESAYGHTDVMAYSYSRLSELFSGGLMEINRSENISRGRTAFEFIEGRELFDIICCELSENSQRGCEYIYRYAENLRARATERFSFTEKFYEMFGHSLKDGDFYSMSYTDIDLCFDNIIVNDGKWIITDYEFCADFTVPVDFVIFRAVFYLFIKSPFDIDDELKNRIYSHLGIDKYKEAFRRMEYRFQQFICGESS